MKLVVHVAEARNLLPLSPSPSAAEAAPGDLYAKLQLGRQLAKTKAIRRSSSPAWGEEFTFRVSDLEEELLLCVVHEDNYLPDDFLGQVRVSLSAVLDAGNRSLGTQWYQLQPRSNKSNISRDYGEIRLTISLSQSYPEETTTTTLAHWAMDDLTSSTISQVSDKQDGESSVNMSFDAHMKAFASRPAENMAEVVIDQVYAIAPGDLNVLLFRPSSGFVQSFWDMRGSTDLDVQQWRFENDGEVLKRVVSYKNLPTKLIKAVKTTEEMTYLKADRDMYVVLSHGRTPDIPFGNYFRLEVLTSITPGPELADDERSSRLVISWRLNFSQRTMLRGMIERGTRQGLKESYNMFSKLLARYARPVEATDSETSVNMPFGELLKAFTSRHEGSDVPVNLSARVLIDQFHAVAPSDLNARLAISWLLNSVQSTIMKGMTVNGAKQGSKDNFNQFTKLLARRGGTYGTVSPKVLLTHSPHFISHPIIPKGCWLQSQESEGEDHEYQGRSDETLEALLSALGHCDGSFIDATSDECSSSARSLDLLQAPSELETMLWDESSRPLHIPLHDLKEITDNFSDERILGQGGFGVVYKGVLRNGKMIAVKKARPSLMLELHKQFESEVYHLMMLKHPNIVRCVGYCYETRNECLEYNGSFVFAEMAERLICLEYLHKGSLDKYLSDESSGLDWSTRYKIIEGICHGLCHLHDQTYKPIIHLDLKPANILLDDSLVPKITDFGLSRLIGQQQTICTSSCVGTRGYMAPEFLLGGIITPKVDIFSLGVIIMEIITGHRDYPGITGTSTDEFIELALEKWRNVLQRSPGYESLEKDCRQIKRCIQAGLLCVNPDRTKRPPIATIINMLRGSESIDCNINNEVA